MTRPRRGPRRALALALVGLLLAGGIAACSDDGSDGASSDGGGAPTTAAGPEVDRGEVLAGLADDVIVPAYEAFAADFEAFDTAIGALCATPSPETLEAGREAWRATVLAWQRTRPGAVGPATEKRLMSAVGFEARVATIEDLLAGTEPVDTAALLKGGAVIRGLYSAEVGLFAEGSDALAAAAGSRRCQYLTAVSGLALEAAAEVRDDWTGGYRDEFVDGMDGDQQMSVAELLNEVTNRLRQLDEQGFRDLAAAESLDELDESRLDGAAGYAMAQRKALLDGVVALIGDAEGGIVALTAERSPDTADRLVEATAAAVDALAPLPDSVAAAFEQTDDIATAADDIAELKVLLATEVASQLGVTITFSDSDGDS